MQAPVGANDDMAARQRKEKTIQAVYAHGSMQLSLGHTLVPGLRNVEKVYHIKQLKKDGTTIMLKKSMAGILHYLKWDEEKFSRACGLWRTDRPWFSFPTSSETLRLTS